MLLVTLGCCLILGGCSGDGREPNRKYSPAELRADMRQAKAMIQRLHPKTFAPFADVAKAFERQAALIQDSMTAPEFIRLLAPAVSPIKCGHTRLWLDDISERYLEDSGRFLPFDGRIVNDTLVVTEVYQGRSRLSANDIVISLNGLPFSGALRRAKSCLWADGSAEGYKTWEFNQRFRWYYRLLVDHSDEFEIVSYSFEDEDYDTILVPAVPLEQDLPPTEEDEIFPMGEFDHWVSFSISDDSAVCGLDVNFFDYFDNDEHFKGTLDRFFERYANEGCQSLILDLRDNDGGSPEPAAYVLQYLLPKPFIYFQGYGAGAYPALGREIQPTVINHFEGDLYVLIDEGCFSTTGHLLSLLRQQGRGTFIGTTSSGSWVCNGGYVERDLNNTGIGMLIPRKNFATTARGLPFGEGIAPDIEIKRSVADFIAGRDVVRDSAMALARRESD